MAKLLNWLFTTPIQSERECGPNKPTELVESAISTLSSVEGQVTQWATEIEERGSQRDVVCDLETVIGLHGIVAVKRCVAAF